MKPLTTDEVLNLFEYEKVREERRAALIAFERSRRVPVGRYLSFVFENRDTVWFQIQEMCRAERIVDDAKIGEEVAVYNALLPGPGELAATMLIEIEAASEIKPVLDKRLGIDTRDYVRLEVGPHVVVGRFEVGHSDEELGKLSAVHFVRFALPEEARRVLRAASDTPDTEIAIIVEHPNERIRVALSADTKRALAADLE